MADNAETPLDTPHEEILGFIEENTDNPFDAADDGDAPDGAPGGNLLDKIKKAPPWVWIGLALAAGTLVIGIMAYRRNANASYAGGYNTTGAPQSDGTNGYQLDNSTAQLFSTVAQNQQTENSLLAQLIAQLKGQSTTGGTPTTGGNKPFIPPPNPIKKPIPTSHNAPAPVAAQPRAPVTWPWSSPPINHGPSIGTPVREQYHAPQPAHVAPSYHWRVS